MSTFTVALISSERMFRELIVERLQRDAPEVEVREAQSVARLDVGTTPPDCILTFLDVGRSSSATLSEICKAQSLLPNRSIAIISDCQDRAFLARALELGVMGFVPTSMAVDTLVHSLRLMVSGAGVISPNLLVSAPAIGDVPDGDERIQSYTASFTGKERGVLNLLRHGTPNKMIASTLGLDETAVKHYVRSLMRKTGTHNRVELALVSLGLASRSAVTS